MWCDVSSDVEVYWDEEWGCDGHAGGVGGQKEEDLVRMINLCTFIMVWYICVCLFFVKII